jgi:hypothetical protein
MPLYIDPGAGSLLVQVAISALLGVAFFFHRAISGSWRSVRGAASRLRRRLRVAPKSEGVEGERPSRSDRAKRS